MQKEQKIKWDNLSQEEKDRLVGFFELLIKMDKKQNPNLYKKEK